ncbi:MAG: Holliday junction branch migration protein RuvA [Anaerococcus sp.]|uniref:Holliday junction branch migration protein RuvA n=1 Tax=Anaerococcus sp. TaxID=1872515 RepID=UPI00261814C1|nr:Holliday junction branch migration protein RuvA [Anaerococcus sp.]MCI5972557.1 Holliday junction branch migration protein RuvA [Anaerococcus sp.]MDD6919364.1 Holliday junction branch migration protein RuvA [Peptoniphilaceae bacterium]MDY2928087.1 Holliday junction branch migration protein RuvA [Anaerococcus sp.]
MISYIIGHVRSIKEDSFIIENNNMGYLIFSSLATLSNIEINNEYKIYTSMQVREDDISLFGFFTKDELEMFTLLTSVSTIGPKIAMGILSSISVNEIKTAIINNDIDKLTVAKGIGKKSASRIILELVDKVKKMDFVPVENIVLNSKDNEEIDVAREALLNLGYEKNDVEKVLFELKDTDLSLEGLIKESLKRLI